MENSVLGQLLDLVAAFNKAGLRPIICGGLGIYLSLHERQKEMSLRTTNDIDLMLTRRQVLDCANREAIAEIITDNLDYMVCEDGKYFMFEKGEQKLDILTCPGAVDGVEVDGFRAKLVKSRLHAYITPEAVFIEEDMRTISLSELFRGNDEAKGLTVNVPSPTNLIILKLFAFNDRDSGPRQDDAKACAHAFDIYVIVTLANRQDYREGAEFLARHCDSDIIQKAKGIVRDKFSTDDSVGWIRVLETAVFYSDLNIQQKREKIVEAKARLVRWFS
ncbi:MAG: nucleotidyl transferase AbiEii/AbiGii toxin family protein [bacterium]